MDSITQAVLGAAVGEAARGRKLGGRAALWGAVAGTLPDLDVLAYPFIGTAAELHVHRGPTHSLFFAPVVAPLLGWAVWRLYRARGRPGDRWRDWTAVFFWALFTHPLLDAFTVYGTQLLWPLSNYPFGVGSVFIIDPLYTVPLAAGLGVALWLKRGSAGRRRAVWAGLVLSTAYLGWGLWAQAQARAAVAATLEAEGRPHRRMLVAATPFNTLLWYALVDTGEDGFLVGTRSLFDGARPVALEAVPQRPELLAPYRPSYAVETLVWFSRGYWRAEPPPSRGGPEGGGPEGGVRVADLRFGRLDEAVAEAPRGDYVFAWDVRAGPDGAGPDGDVTLETVRPDTRIPPGFFGRLLDRIRGAPPDP